MFCNLKSIKLESFRREYRPEGTVYLELTIAGEEHNYTDSVYLTVGQAIVLADSLAGQVNGLAVLDGYNAISGDMHGIDILKPSDPMHNYTFPGEFLAAWIRAAVANLPDDIAEYQEGENTYTRTYGEHITGMIAADHAPIVYIDYADGVLDRLIRDMSDTRQTRLGDCLESLRRVTSGYSDGKPATLHIRLDDSYHAANYPDEPTSYYWWITTHDDRRGMNGGLIAHHNHPVWDYENNCKVDTPPENRSWEYSTHT